MKDRLERNDANERRVEVHLALDGPRDDDYDDYDGAGRGWSLRDMFRVRRGIKVALALLLVGILAAMVLR